MKNNKIKTIADLTPDKRNTRKHNPRNIGMIRESLGKVGAARSIVIDEDGNILAGNGTVEALADAGIEKVRVIETDGEEIVAVMRKGLTDQQKLELALADNRTAELAEWDPMVLEELNLEVPDVLAGMFSPVELDDIFSLNDSIGPIDGEDDAPDPPEEPVSKLGDLYQLGEHRLLCGDSTAQDQVERLMDGQKADMVFTSPPYNANSKMPDGDVFGNKPSKPTYKEYVDDLPSDEYILFVRNVLNVCFSITDGFIFWNVNYNVNSRFEYISQISEKLPFLIEQVAWIKSSAIPFKGSMQRGWESIYIFSTDKKSLGLDVVTSNVWKINNTNSQHSHHKACFPVALPEKAIDLISPPARVVYDPFGGSGSTLIACEKLKRKCYMMELDPIYCDVIVNRWEQFTGNKAELIPIN